MFPTMSDRASVLSGAESARLALASELPSTKNSLRLSIEGDAEGFAQATAENTNKIGK